jgi:NTE family protein
MKYWFLTAVLLVSLLSYSPLIYSQNPERPKIGLVLSGGGAKGMAHIGILKELESLGIKPDYITGTSMGSIVGGLYAAGYSADEIETIARGLNWDQLLSNQVSLDQVTYEEKPYYQRYIIELGIQNYSLRLPNGVIEGQMLSELLTSLTRHVHDVTDFNDLPIPFACVATDITTGEAVVLNKGSLAQALRASMAIPSIFTPVSIGSNYLVDGGLVRNFPVKEARDMGADIIIGVFVSDDLLTKDQLLSVVDVLTQSSFVMSVFDSREQKKDCDLLIEPVLPPYTTFSFEDTDGIIQRGEEAAEKVRPQLKALADSLGFTPGFTVERPILKDTFFIKKIFIENNRNVSDEFIKKRLRIEENHLISLLSLQERIEVLYGSRYFDKVTYQLAKHDDGYDLVINVQEAIPSQLKMGLHYDSENGVGMNVNVTTRELLPSSRVVLDLDIAENFRVDFNMLKYLKNTEILAVKTGINYRNGDVPIIDQNVQEAIFKNDYLNPYISFFTTSRRNYIAGITLQHERSVLTPRIASGDLRQLDKLRWNSWSSMLGFSYNSMQSKYFPKEGAIYTAEAKYSFGIDYDINIQDTLGIFPIDLDPQDFFSFTLKQHNRWKLSERLTAGLQNVVIMNFFDRNNAFETIAPFFNDQIFTGGYRPLLRNSLPFWGADQLSFLTDHLFYNEILFQYEVVDNIFLEGASQYMNSEYPMKWFYKGIEDDVTNLTGNSHSLWGYGFKASYMSIAGPITFGIASHNKTSKWNPFFGIGFYF